MKKKGYYEYGNGIYPLKLWVHIGKDLKELIDSCFDKCNAPDIDYGGVTYSDAVRKSDRRRGVHVSFPCQKVMSMNYCLPRSFSRRRAFCPYLMGWIASCINNARLGIGDFVELKDEEE